MATPVVSTHSILTFTAAVLAAGLSGCGPEPVSNASCTTFTNEDLTISVECPDGTSVVLAGPDKEEEPPSGDGDTDTGAIDSDEAPQYAPPGSLGILQGSFTLENELDYAILSQYTGVAGYLHIRNSLWSQLPPLPDLSFIGGDLDIEDNPNLVSLEGLNSLTSIGGSLLIDNSPSLASFSGLDQLTSVGDALSIARAASEDLQGLNALVSVGGSLSIAYNDALINFEGLESLISVGGEFDIQRNDALTSFDGLENLTTIGGRFRVSRNSSIATLGGLDALATVGGDFVYSGAGPLCESFIQTYASVIQVLGDIEINGSEC